MVHIRQGIQYVVESDEWQQETKNLEVWLWYNCRVPDSAVSGSLGLNLQLGPVSCVLEQGILPQTLFTQVSVYRWVKV